MKKRIMLVDDSDIVRETVRCQLEAIGYEVRFEARSGREALEIFRANQNKIDLIITDCEMEDGSGIDLIWVVRRILPLTPMILMTGKVVEFTKTALDAGASAILSKPFGIEELEQALISTTISEEAVSR